MSIKIDVQYIKGITEKYNSKSLSEIAKNENIKVVVGDLTTAGLSGAILFDSKLNQYIIYIDSQSSISRQKFTFAHELGHYFLHKNILDKNKSIKDKSPSKYLYRGEEYDGLTEEEKKRELEANEFAGNLLMPESTVIKYYKEFPIDKLAKIFGVSIQALAVRLYNLNLTR